MTSKPYFRTLSILHGGLLAGQCLLGGLLLLLRAVKNNASEYGHGMRETDAIFYVAMSFVFGGIVAGHFLFQAKVRLAKDQTSTAAALSIYRGAFITRDALLEGPSLFALVSFALTGNIKYLMLSGLIVLLFVLWWPSEAKVMDQLGKEGEEITEED